MRSSYGERFQEYLNLLRFHKNQSASKKISSQIRNLTAIGHHIEEIYKQPLKEQNILEIGPGQMLKQSYFFAQHNNVTALDYDVIVRGLKPLGYIKMAQKNGLRRAIKTIGRQILGIDRYYYDGLRDHFGVKNLKKPLLLQGDATNMNIFEDNHFDVVMSFSVFEHIVKPKPAIDEIKRVLRPEGVVYLGIHPFSSESGNHDPKVLAENRDDIPYWAHLRPHFKHLTQGNAYCNKITISDWKKMLSDAWTGCEFKRFGRFDDSEALSELADIRAAGELSDYTDEDLLTDFLVCVWRKPIL